MCLMSLRLERLGWASVSSRSAQAGRQDRAGRGGAGEGSGAAEKLAPADHGTDGVALASRHASIVAPANGRGRASFVVVAIIALA